MILAILPDASNTEHLLNSLTEAEFNLNDVSVILQDIAMRNKIAKDVGPLQGVDPGKLAVALQETGISREDAKRCQDAVAGGKALVAMKVVPKFRPAAREVFADHGAEIMRE